MENENILVEVTNLKKYFSVSQNKLFKEKEYTKAVDGISFFIKKGEIFGIVGESGSGKSTTGRMLMRLIDVTSGTINFDGKDITTLKGSPLRKLRSEFQIIFQDPYSALNPRKKIGWILEEPLKIQGIKDKVVRVQKVIEMIKLLGFDENILQKYPHELSGGQRQRIVIGSALMVNPKFVIADEPVSALDVSVQAQILNLMLELHKKFSLTYLFISHNLNVVHYMCDRVGVMYLGKIVELGSVEDIYNSPQHPYTKALISAIPDISTEEETKQIVLDGEIPFTSEVATGCVFQARCPNVCDTCRNTEPEMRNILKEKGKEHFVSCHRASL